MGGYKIIDLKDLNIVPNADTPVVIKGVYSAIESTRKVTIVDHLVIDGVDKRAREVIFGVSGDDFVGGLGYDADGNIMSITVNADDEVTITTTNSGNSSSSSGSSGSSSWGGMP